MHIQVSAEKGGERCGICFLGFVSAWPAAPGRPRERRRRRPRRSRSAAPSSGTSPTTRTSPARTAAVDSVEVRARVWGYLDKVNFKEGALVKKGTSFLRLDPRPYQALLNQAKAKVAQDEAQLTYDEAEYQRNLEPGRTAAVSAIRPGQERRGPGRRCRQRGGRQGRGRVAPAGPGATRRSPRRSAGASAATSSRWAT